MFGLEKIAPREGMTKKERINVLIQYLINNSHEKGPLGSDLPFEVIETIVNDFPDVLDRYPGFINSLKRDGYIIKEHKLQTVLPDIVQMPNKEDELSSLFKKFEGT